MLSNLVYVNVFWGLLNWLPIRPLDGGHLLESLLEKIAPKRANLIAKVIFTVTAAAALVVAVWLNLIFVAVLAGWLLLMEFNTGRRPRQPSPGLPTLSYDDPEPDPVEDEPVDDDGTAREPEVAPTDGREETPGPTH